MLNTTSLVNLPKDPGQIATETFLVLCISEGWSEKDIKSLGKSKGDKNVKLTEIQYGCHYNRIYKVFILLTDVYFNFITPNSLLGTEMYAKKYVWD